MRIVCAILGFIYVLSATAEACPPPPPPPPPEAGESNEAYQTRLAALRAAEAEVNAQRVLQMQQGWWDESQSVLLARVVRRDSIRLKDNWGEIYGRSPRVLLRPVRWLKGSGSSRRFRLNYEGLTSCGPYGGGDAVDGEIGEVFVVFVREGRPRQDSVITSLAMDRVRDPRVLALLPQNE